jgi:hypothetical protein
VQGIMWLFPLSLSQIEKEELVFSVREPKTPGPGVNEDGPLAIEYLYTENLPGDEEAVFEATNYGSEAVRLSDDSNGLTLCGLHEGIRPGIYLAGSVVCRIDKTSLNPLESTEIRVRVYYEDIGYFLSVNYVTSDKKDFRTNLIVRKIKKPKFEPLASQGR